ncbi:MAG: hypothetical protein RLP44_03925 [Aggregatilineales bacterium]
MQYGIITVPATWNINRPIGFSQNEYQQWHEEIKTGCRVLVFQSAPVYAIVAEGIVQDNIFQKLENWPLQSTHPVMTFEGNEAEYVMTLRILRNYSTSTHIPADRVGKVADLDTISTRTWTPLDVDIYRALRDASQ